MNTPRSITLAKLELPSRSKVRWALTHVFLIRKQAPLTPAIAYSKLDCYGEPAKLVARLRAGSGTLQHDGRTFIVVYNRGCSPETLAKARVAYVSYREALPIYNLPSYALISVPLVDRE